MVNKEAARENFQVAAYYYEQAKSVIKDLSDYCHAVDPTFSYDLAIQEFDIILQAFLLRVAIEDGYYVEDEQVFMEEIVEHNDLMYQLRNAGYDLTWNSIRDYKGEDREGLVNNILIIQENVLDHFISSFAFIDALTPENYAIKLGEILCGICKALALCDGDKQNSDAFKKESETILKLVNGIFVEKWYAVKDSVQ